MPSVSLRRPGCSTVVTFASDNDVSLRSLRCPRPPLTQNSWLLSALCGVASGAGGDRVDERAAVVRGTLDELGWGVLVAGAHKVQGLAPLACKTDKIDARVLAAAFSAHRSGAAPAVKSMPRRQLG